ncbi:MAG: NUDIX domain-containing protein [Anaerolineae bacterium]|nr:NUDIX domain-containing protein [Anaerolineae bacterium]
MTQVKCRTFFNDVKYVDAESLIQRPSVYGLVLDGSRLLVVKTRYTPRFVLPGGGIEKGEAIEAALVREVREEAGIPIQVGEFLHFETDFFYYDPLDLAFHSFLFFYRCIPLATTFGVTSYTPDEGLEKPMWVDVANLRQDDFQAQGEVTMRLLDRLLK